MAEAADPRAGERITRILDDLRAGDRGAWSRLVPLVYAELRRLARYRLAQLQPGATLLTTDLVHESYLKLAASTRASFENRRHFFGAAALAMRDILVDAARKRRRQKRVAGWDRVAFDEEVASEEGESLDLLALDEALKKLAEEDGEQHNVVMLRYFGGLTVDEIAAVLEVSPSTVDRQWKFARAWLHRELSAG